MKKIIILTGAIALASLSFSQGLNQVDLKTKSVFSDDEGGKAHHFESNKRKLHTLSVVLGDTEESQKFLKARKAFLLNYRSNSPKRSLEDIDMEITAIEKKLIANNTNK